MERRHFLQTSGLAFGSVLIDESVLAVDSEKMCDKPRMPKQPVYGINDWLKKTPSPKGGN